MRLFISFLYFSFTLLFFFHRFRFFLYFFLQWTSLSESAAAASQAPRGATTTTRVSFIVCCPLPLPPPQGHSGHRGGYVWPPVPWVPLTMVRDTMLKCDTRDTNTLQVFRSNYHIYIYIYIYIGYSSYMIHPPADQLMWTIRLHMFGWINIHTWNL